MPLAQFINGEKLDGLPFDLMIDGTLYVCTEVLRLLPAKRLVVKAHSAEQTVVIKMFAKAKKGERELARELQGYHHVEKTGVKTPKLLFTVAELSGCCAVAYEYLEQAQPIESGSSLELLEQTTDLLFELTATLHQSACYQSDFHLDNILMKSGHCFLIDLASINCTQESDGLNKQESLANLALLIVQFKGRQQDYLSSKVEDYYHRRGWLFDEREKKAMELTVNKAWLKRKVNYLSKCFRSCTMTDYKKTLSTEYGFQRAFINAVGRHFINDIDQVMSQGKMLKDGNSATVVQINHAGVEFVVKRYNIKGIWHFVSRCFRPSRAAVSWKNANLLELIGVATPTPFGFIEKRFLGLRYTAYFISEMVPAKELLDVYEEKMPTERELQQLQVIFTLLQQYQISHGDLKAQNLLLDEQESVLLIDLDAMKECSSLNSFQRAFAKDKARFLRNWHAPKIKALFAETLAEITL